MKLIHKFFVAFFVTSMALVGLMFVFMYLTFSVGFNDFVEKEEQKHVQAVKQHLIAYYQESNSWQAMSQDSSLWRSMVGSQATPNASNEAPQKALKGSSLEPKRDVPSPSFLWINLPPDSLKTGQRISLYDANQQVIVGREAIHDNPQIDAITLNNNVIGWIGFEPSRLVESSPAKAFLSAQFHNYFMVALGVILLAFVVSIVLSRHLMKPINAILAGTNALKNGLYTTRMTPATQDELGILSNNFNELAQVLEHNEQMRAQWVSDTSHELRTPLTVLRSHLLAVQDGLFQPDEKRIALLIKQTDHLEHIVNDLTQLANSDAATLIYKKTPLNIIAVLNACLEDFSPRFEQQSLVVDRAALQKTPSIMVQGDHDRLQQLFVNLLENSCKYTHAGGTLRINVTQTANHVELALEDSAPSVSSDDQQKLFDRFYRVEKSRHRDLGGSGLGLALCKQIVEAHGGEISLDNASLGGLAVVVRLPLLIPSLKQ